MDGDPARRRAEVAAGLAAVRGRIEAACLRLGRDPAAVTLVVITKTHPPSDVRLLAGLGVRDVGENRDQEAAPKAAACAELGMRWHFVGRLQSNKARSVAGYAVMVHSVDRASLAAALGKAAARRGGTLDCLVQVSLDGDPSRGGALIENVPAVAAAIAGETSLRMRGVMAVAPLAVDPLAAFAPLPRLLEQLQTDHPAADVLSAGMSADLEAALAWGATHLRVGSAVLGERPPLG